MLSGAHYRFNSQAKKIQDNRVGRQKVGPTYGFTTSPEVDLGATVDTLQTEYPYIQALSQDREWGVHCHVSCSTGPCLLVKVGSEAGTCLVAPVPVSLLGRALVPLRVLRLRTLPPCLEGSSTITNPTVPCGLQASSIKKNLAGMSMQLGSRVFKTRTYVSKASDVKVIMGLQDVRAGCTFSACKTCGQAATVQHRSCRPLTRHRYSVGRPDSMTSYFEPSTTW
jgi:hypothetical protein